jgi:peptide/nickel transport system substrate-binding protein
MTSAPIISRRSALRLLGSTAGIALAAACGPAPQATTPQAPAPTPKPAAPPTSVPPVAAAPTSPPAAAVVVTQAQQSAPPQPRSGGTLRAALTADLPNLDPHINTTTAHENLFLAFDRIIQYDDQLHPQPMLAESWDLSTDLRQIKFNLRKGVQWHTGREFTSEDVKWNLLRVRDPKSPSVGFRNQSNWFTTIETPDKNSIILKSEQPRPALFDLFEYLNIIDPVTMEGPDAKVKAVGTGPFVFSEWAQGDHILLTRNKNYWQTGRPYLEEVRVSILRDAQAMVAQLEGGAVDLIKAPPLRDAARLKADPQYRVVSHPASAQHFQQGVNTLVPPLDNKKVRQALNYALDRKRFSDTALLGTGQPIALPWLSSSPAYDAQKRTAFAFDLDKAKSLLNEAGVSNPSFEFLPLGDYPELTQMAQIYQNDLAKIGVTISIKNLENAAFYDSVNGRKYQGLYSTPNTYAQVEPLTIFTTSRVFDPSSNNSGFRTDAYVKLIDDAGSEPDAAKRRQLYVALNDLLLDESFSMILVEFRPQLLTRSTVNDVGHTLHEAFSYTNTWLSA